MEKSVAILGAGAVGTNAAVFLAAMGIEVNLFESRDDILQGSPLVSFINHGDGFEYYKPGVQITGMHCIDGAIAKGLLYPLHCFRTNVLSKENPIRFLVSDEAVKSRLTPLHDFHKNAEFMKRHFEGRFRAICNAKDWTPSYGAQQMLRSPKSFYRKLHREDLSDLAGVSGGCEGSGFGVNMPQYYAFLKAAIAESGVRFYPGAGIERIEKRGGEYLIHYNGTSLKAAQVLVTANHHIPQLAKLGSGFSINGMTSGTYYLNSMTFLDLPPTTDSELLARLAKVNFTLQGDFGAMFACVVPPSDEQAGLAVIYYPSIHGSQLATNVFNKDVPIDNSPEWDHLIANGLANTNQNVINTFEQACRFYPFLRDYANVRKTECRTVFNVSISGNQKGLDRRVRVIKGGPLMSSECGTLTMWSAPKWTNAELTGLIAADHVRTTMGMPPLPKSLSGCGLGPTAIDVPRVSDEINFHHLQMNPGDALRYAELQGVPARIVNQGLDNFTLSRNRV